MRDAHIRSNVWWSTTLVGVITWACTYDYDSFIVGGIGGQSQYADTTINDSGLPTGGSSSTGVDLGRGGTYSPSTQATGALGGTESTGGFSASWSPLGGGGSDTSFGASGGVQQGGSAGTAMASELGGNSDIGGMQPTAGGAVATGGTRSTTGGSNTAAGGATTMFSTAQGGRSVAGGGMSSSSSWKLGCTRAADCGSGENVSCNESLCVCDRKKCSLGQVCRKRGGSLECF